LFKAGQWENRNMTARRSRWVTERLSLSSGLSPIREALACAGASIEFGEQLDSFTKNSPKPNIKPNVSR
jgi:hypothetical protein